MTAPYVPLHVEQAIASTTRDHMRRSGVPFVKSVPWVRAQCNHEFASVYKEDEPHLHDWLTKVNQDAVDRYGFTAVRRCHTNSRGRIFVAFTDEFIQYYAERITVTQEGPA